MSKIAESVPAHLIEEQQEREKAQRYRDLKSYLKLCGTCLDTARKEKNHKTAATWHLELIRTQLAILHLKPYVDTRFLTYAEGGEIDDCPYITTQTVISGQTEDEYDNPRYSSGTQMGQTQVYARESSMEDTGRLLPDDSSDGDDSKLQDEVVRRAIKSLFTHDFKGNHFRALVSSVGAYLWEASDFVSKSSWWGGEVYLPRSYRAEGRNGTIEWVPNIRIAMGGVAPRQPSCLPDDWPGPPQMWKEFWKEVTVSSHTRFETIHTRLVRTMKTTVPQQPYKVTKRTRVSTMVVVIDPDLKRTRPVEEPLHVRLRNGAIVKARMRVRYLAEGSGIPFKGSSQLSPPPGMEYSSNANYSYRGELAKMLYNRFMRALEEGTVQLCKHVEGKGAARKTKRQAYKVFTVKVDVGTRTVTRRHLVFCDLAEGWRR